MKSLCGPILAACVLLPSLVAAATSATSATSATPAARPHEAVAQEGCVRDACHADVRRHAVIHGPVGANACDACHELTNAAAHTFKLTREKADLCTFCHEFDLSSSPVVHKPVAEGQCIACHDAHGGATNALLRENTVRATCNRCHEDITHDRTFLHTPVKEGACDSCHPPHASRFPKLLDRAGSDLCLACHEGFNASLATAKFTHKALEKGCEKCHDPHGSKFVMSTTQPVVEQCGGCHEKMITDARTSTYPHTPVLKGDRACLACHTPHGGNLAKLVSDVPEKLCMGCHAKEQKAAGGRTVPSVAELMSPQVKHGGIKDGSCAGCHASHGGERQLFLSKNYSTAFYQRYAAPNYELCFGCHDSKLVTETTTTQFTAFRNGARNLHALHVRDTRERGENCRDCHQTHGSLSERLIRQNTAFGAWTLPLRFNKTSTGGSCYPGCHPQYGYDRKLPIANTLGRATTLPASQPIVREQPARIVLKAKDRAGASIAIPGGNRPVVMALLRADQTQQQNYVRDLLATTLRGRGDVQVIVVRTGSGTGPAASTAATMPSDWSILSDADGSIAAELGIHGWPTLLVLSPAGIELARLCGSAETTAGTLPAYLDLAAGKMDTPRPAASAVQGIVGPEATLQNARGIRRIEYLIVSGRAEDALKTLRGLSDGALPPWQYNLLGARALATLNRWPEAKRAAEAALAQNRDLPEAHYLLGQFYERAQDWSHAAVEYRAAMPSTVDYPVHLSR